LRREICSDGTYSTAPLLFNVGPTMEATMSQTHQDSIRRSAAVRIRICPACGSPGMRIVIAKPSIQHANLDECIYRCTCGEEAVQVMMRPA
jgi:hypothetical protein